MEQKFDIAGAKWTPPPPPPEEPWTVSNVYLDIPTIPAGYEAIDFRPPIRGEKYIDLCGLEVVECDEVRHCTPSLIVRAVDTVESIYGAPLEKLSPPKGYEFTGEFRAPEDGETILNPYGPQSYYTTHCRYPSSDRCLILRRDWKCEVKLEDVYSNYNIPKGYRAVDFRIPRTGDLFVARTFQKAMATAVWDCVQGENPGPRLIVEKI